MRLYRHYNKNGHNFYHPACHKERLTTSHGESVAEWFNSYWIHVENELTIKERESNPEFVRMKELGWIKDRKAELVDCGGGDFSMMYPIPREGRYAL